MWQEMTRPPLCLVYKVVIRFVAQIFLYMIVQAITLHILNHWYCLLLYLVMPLAVATPTSQELSAGEIALFDCVTYGDPAPQVRWLNAMSVDVTSLSDPRIEVIIHIQLCCHCASIIWMMLLYLSVPLSFSLLTLIMLLHFSSSYFLPLSLRFSPMARWSFLIFVPVINSSICVRLTAQLEEAYQMQPYLF